MDIVSACMHLFNIGCFGNSVLQPSDLCIVYPAHVLDTSVWDYEISFSLWLSFSQPPPVHSSTKSDHCQLRQSILAFLLSWISSHSIWPLIEVVLAGWHLNIVTPTRPEPHHEKKVHISHQTKTINRRNNNVPRLSSTSSSKGTAASVSLQVQKVWLLLQRLLCTVLLCEKAKRANKGKNNL